MSESRFPGLVRPFCGLRPVPEKAALVAAPPYDVLNSEEARERAAGNPLSFLHVSKAEIDLPPETDPYDDVVYAQAGKAFRAMVADGILIRDETPCYYVYRLTMEGRTQTGVVVGASVSAYDQNIIRKHELTRPAKEDDRVRQIEAVAAQTGPVFLTHRPLDAVTRVVDDVTSDPALYDITADDGVRHELWVVGDQGRIAELTDAFEEEGVLYIADGHHRSAAASRVAAGMSAGPDDAASAFLAVAFPTDQMRILDYNRIVRDLGGMDAPAFLDRIGEAFSVETVSGRAQPTRAQELGLYLRGKWYRLRVREAMPPESDPVARLDVSLLTDRILSPLLGIEDLRRDARIDFVGGIRGLGELERLVDSGDWAAAFALYPTSIDDLLAVADAGSIMPPKSTWFEPKLADGLVSYPLD
ncbi:MAG: DUF1015 family protein [Rhodospirillales bacterium]|nr:DUF1015 family protein [Rhodospirillales bacterium]MCW8862775.1 DUF1015 family protein [Rhodospirillales bacterium]MCW8952094.1 DUF1015 family protein [Rhodospirillales bacterium]MCW8971065.1 DUF1015 family protein [Rhodospirillales bacterium]MCW9002924.1 DUF1015 family protein [Rhodospirillales bacterium]